MSEFEKNFSKRWDRLFAKLQLSKVNAWVPFHLAKETFEYNRQVPNDFHQRTCVSTDQFAGEFFSFLDQDSYKLLKPLELTPAQLSAFYLTTDEFSNNNLLKRQTSKWIHGREKYPYLTSTYRFSYFDNDLTDRAAIWAASKIVNWSFHWLPIQNIPGSISLFGFMGGREDFTISFLPLFSKAEDIENIRLHLPAMFTNPNISIYNNGERIVVNNEYKKGRENVATTQQYHFLGSFNSEVVDSDIFIYGSNEKRHYRQAILESRATLEKAVSPGLMFV